MLNTIKSIKILNIILGKLKRRIELKLIKYNKKIIYRLKITGQDFENFKLLKEMEQTFNLNIKDIDITELNLKNKNLGNVILEYLKNIDFKELKELYLSENKISDIKALERVKYEKLETLDLNSNQISDINVVKKINCKELKVLILYKNNISEIGVLEKVKFGKLERLDLSINKIFHIDILGKTNLKN